MSEKEIKIDCGLVSEFRNYPSGILFNMLEMSQAVSKSLLIDDDKLKHISQIVGDQIRKELASRN